MTEFQHTPSSLICFIDKYIAGTEYIKVTVRRVVANHSQNITQLLLLLLLLLKSCDRRTCCTFIHHQKPHVVTVTSHGHVHLCGPSVCPSVSLSAANCHAEVASVTRRKSCLCAGSNPHTTNAPESSTSVHSLFKY